MTSRTKADLEHENEELRAKLEQAYGVIGEALGYEDDDEDDGGEDSEEDED